MNNSSGRTCCTKNVSGMWKTICTHLHPISWPAGGKNWDWQQHRAAMSLTDFCCAPKLVGKPPPPTSTLLSSPTMFFFTQDQNEVRPLQPPRHHPHHGLVLLNFLCLGSLNNTSRWQAITPQSFRSPWYVQGDLGEYVFVANHPPPPSPPWCDQQSHLVFFFLPGFFSTNRKKYGIFFLAVQTYTKKLFVLPIKSTKSDDLHGAIKLMMKVNLTGVASFVLFFIVLILFTPPSSPPGSPFQTVQKTAVWRGDCHAFSHLSAPNIARVWFANSCRKRFPPKPSRKRS